MSLTASRMAATPLQEKHGTWHNVTRKTLQVEHSCQQSSKCLVKHKSSRKQSFLQPANVALTQNGLEGQEMTNDWK